MNKYNIGDNVYHISNSIYIRVAKIISVHGDFYTIRFLDRGNSTRVRSSKLYSTEQEAKNVVKQHIESSKQYVPIKFK